jgi:hypothetical protein
LLFTETDRHDKTTAMKFVRLGFLVLLSSAGLTSCQTWDALKNSFPVRMLDDTGSSMLKMLGENKLPADGKPATMQERARQIASRGRYAGKAPAAGSPAGNVAAR